MCVLPSSSCSFTTSVLGDLSRDCLSIKTEAEEAEASALCLVESAPLWERRSFNHRLELTLKDELDHAKAHPVARSIYEAITEGRASARAALPHVFDNMNSPDDCEKAVASFAECYPRCYGGSVAKALRTVLRAAELASCEAALNNIGATLGVHPVAEALYNTLEASRLGRPEDEVQDQLVRAMKAVADTDECQKVVDTFYVTYNRYHDGDLIAAMRAHLTPPVLAVAQGLFHRIGVTLGADIEPASYETDLRCSSLPLSRCSSGRSFGSSSGGPSLGSKGAAVGTFVKKLSKKLTGMIGKHKSKRAPPSFDAAKSTERHISGSPDPGLHQSRIHRRQQKARNTFLQYALRNERMQQPACIARA